MRIIIIKTILLFVVAQVAANSFCQDNKGFSWGKSNATNFWDDIEAITNPPIAASLLMPDTLYKDSIEVSIFLKIENNTSKTLTIRDPNNFGCVFLRLMENGKKVEPKRLLSIFDTYERTQISPHETRTTDILNGQKLDELFNLGINPSGEYTISAVYLYGIKEKYAKHATSGGVETEPKTFYLR